MVVTVFSGITDTNKSRAVERLISASTPSQEFFFMVVLSVLMATFGLVLGNIAVVIGSMLIAPMLYAVLSVSLGIILADYRLIGRALYSVGRSLALGIGAAVLAALLFRSNLTTFTPALILEIHPSILYLAVSIIAGLAASFALVHPLLGETLPGVAISVALIPPLSATGIGLALLNWTLATNAFTLFLVNAVGIMFASMVVFALTGMSRKKMVAERTASKEDARVAREVKDAQKRR